MHERERVLPEANQDGGPTPPEANTGWGGEIALIDTVSAACPNCSIILVEADHLDEQLWDASTVVALGDCRLQQPAALTRTSRWRI